MILGVHQDLPRGRKNKWAIRIDPRTWCIIRIGKGSSDGIPRVRLFAESCIRKAVAERGLTPGPVGLADAKAEDEAASRWADRALAYGVC